MSERMPLFMTGWRYITTYEEANDLPDGTLAVVDDAFLWDSSTEEPSYKPELRLSHWDGVVDCQQRYLVHSCGGGIKCADAGCRYVWNENGDTKDILCPELPFFAWHPTFCKLT